MAMVPILPQRHIGPHFTLAASREPGILPVMLSSSLLVFLGLGLGWWFYGRKPIARADAPDASGNLQPHVFTILGHNFYVDAFYGATIVRLNTWLVAASATGSIAGSGTAPCKTVSHLVARALHGSTASSTPTS